MEGLKPSLGTRICYIRGNFSSKLEKHDLVVHLWVLIQLYLIQPSVNEQPARPLSQSLTLRETSKSPMSAPVLLSQLPYHVYNTASFLYQLKM